MPFTFEPLTISDVVLVRPTRYRDDRGHLAEIYRDTQFEGAGIVGPFVQDNLVRSRKHVLRGLHYQIPPHAQGKLVSAVRGAIFDVAVDLRRQSPTYGAWVGQTLDGESGDMLWIPPGFAHGYCTLSDQADVLYKVTAHYAPEHDRGVRWNDPAIGIEWPVDEPLLSEKDRTQPGIAACDNPF